MKEKEKRTSRSPVLLDMDDVFLLHYLSINPDVQGLLLSKLKEKMKMSHSSLLVHLKRLNSFNLIKIVKSLGDKSNRVKVVCITKNGRRIKEEFFEAMKLMDENKYKILVKSRGFWGQEKIEELTLEV